MTDDNQTPGRGPGRPRIRQRPDLRLTVRFRYHCDQDLIQALQEAPNKNALVRNALRHWILQRQDNSNDHATSLLLNRGKAR